ncbi:hypothetical protein LshimejAT787_1601270 [Lyophyllum shimeji]|uniref:Pentatricopeptide repeat-containing protein n=1 Tax=Lyophyllum shimeji TaxID=47721 RepID=A0A9P3PWD1_LYOSH|nr:hypothetical protein LshimejAT787_1601270 [Lyophyllum shimeji]
MQWRHVSTAKRAFSTSSRPVRATKFVDAFLRETKEPIWRVVTALNTPRSLDLPAALARHGVSVEQLRQWRPIAYESNISSAVDLMQRKGLAVARMPSWLVVYLVAFKVRTLENATPTALDLAYTHLPSAPSSVQGPLLILTLLSLARFNLLLPMRRVVDSFLTTNLHHPALCFNLLLQALACTPTRSVDTANAVVAVLKRMDARQLKLTHATYDALLNDRFVTLQLTKYLRERMTREGTVPTAEHLEAYLRVFAKHGLIHKAEDYHQAIHARHRTPVSSESQNAAQDPLHRANTLFLAAQDDRASAFNFLRALLEPSQSSVPAKVKSAKTTYTPAPHNVDAYTYTAALSLAARDHTLPSPALLALFNRLSPSPSTSLTSPIAPTTATHTVLIRGLLARKDFALALGAWERFRKSGLRIDREALSAGVQVLTRAGLPHRAWALLEEVAGPASPPASPSPSPSLSPSPSRSSSKKETQTVPALRRPLEITTVTINDFLVALNRIGRPDVVFAVWDGMRAMYGVQPDARTLSLVLQAARVGWRMDGESWRGAVVRLGFEFRAGRTRGVDAGADVGEGPDPEGTRRGDLALDTRAAHVHRLTALLGAPHLPAPHAYRPGLWHGTLPPTHALRLFQQALFGSARDPRRLVSVQEPARALERSVWGAPEGEGGGAGGGVAQLAREAQEDEEGGSREWEWVEESWVGGLVAPASRCRCHEEGRTRGYRYLDRGGVLEVVRPAPPGYRADERELLPLYPAFVSYGADEGGGAGTGVDA